MKARSAFRRPSFPPRDRRAPWHAVAAPVGNHGAAARVAWCVLLSLFSALLMVCLPTQAGQPRDCAVDRPHIAHPAARAFTDTFRCP